MTGHAHTALPAETDILLVGAGVMSATLGTLLQAVAPQLRITVVDALSEASTESSDAWNNAGTGHAALCELNYTPARPDGSIAIERAIEINEQFQLSRQFWTTLVERGIIDDPARFIHPFPHMSFVSGGASVEFLRRRYAALQQSPLFAHMEYSEDPARLKEWLPLMMDGRDPRVPVAATRADDGTDLDFGALTRMLLLASEARGMSVHFRHAVRGLAQGTDRRWAIEVEDLDTGERRTVITRFIFLGAGGGALLLLQKSAIPEGHGYGGFPVSGQWLRCSNRDVIERHSAKVYGRPALGAPPMSVPHLDARMINGQRELLFGPFAGFSTKFLKSGSYLDMLRSFSLGNVVTMVGAGLHNIDLTRYLIGQVLQSPTQRLAALRDFVPSARAADWQIEIAGQRVQIIKPDRRRGGVLEFGTEIIRSADGTLAGLLGASPGASTAVAIMLELVARGLPGIAEEQRSPEALRRLVPSYGISLHENPELLGQLRDTTTAVLRLA
jgi:malate dehydrogenase (quinone)